MEAVSMKSGRRVGVFAAALAGTIAVLAAAETRQVLSPEQEKYLREHVWAVLATGRQDGSPQVSMMAYEYDGTDIAMSTKSYTAKWKNILRQRKVALLVHDGRKQLIIYGTAKPVAEDPERLELTRRVRERLRGEPLEVDPAGFAAALDRQQRVALRIVPEKAFMND
jgi:PPOX class probable F420-dependent enzyme